MLNEILEYLLKKKGFIHEFDLNDKCCGFLDNEGKEYLDQIEENQENYKKVLLGINNELQNLKKSLQKEIETNNQYRKLNREMKESLVKIQEKLKSRQFELPLDCTVKEFETFSKLLKQLQEITEPPVSQPSSSSYQTYLKKPSSYSDTPPLLRISI